MPWLDRMDPFGNLAGVEISSKDLLIRIIWLRQHATERIDDHAAASQPAPRQRETDPCCLSYMQTPGRPAASPDATLSESPVINVLRFLYNENPNCV
jgi:hypothetical protein